MTELADSRYAWFRLGVALLLMTIGGCCMYAMAVVLPAVQAEFGSGRSQASLPYTGLMLGFGLGGVLMGRIADRRGVMPPLVLGGTMLGIGGVLTGLSTSLWQFALVQTLFLGLLGASCTFGPLVTDISFWFRRKRGIAVAICASGNYLAGAVWPPIVEELVQSHGWRYTYIAIGVFTTLTMVPLALLLRRRAPAQLMQAGTEAGEAAGMGQSTAAAGTRAAHASRPAADGPPAPGTRDPIGRLGLTPTQLFVLLNVAGVACCVAMAMPQVHIVAYCGDLGYGPARGARMLSLMLGCGIVSRVLSGVICDRIGGVRTLLLGSVLQGLALLLFLPFDSLWSLYLVSAMFGLFQGGIVPSYAIIVREYFPPSEAGARVGSVIMATLVGMALGGWMSGKVFDLTGSYHAAFLNGIAWNLLNGSIAVFLLVRQRRASRLNWLPAASPAA